MLVRDETIFNVTRDVPHGLSRYLRLIKLHNLATSVLQGPIFRFLSSPGKNFLTSVKLTHILHHSNFQHIYWFFSYQRSSVEYVEKIHEYFTSLPFGNILFIKLPEITYNYCQNFLIYFLSGFLVACERCPCI